MVGSATVSALDTTKQHLAAPRCRCGAGTAALVEAPGRVFRRGIVRPEERWALARPCPRRLNRRVPNSRACSPGSSGVAVA